MLLDFYSNQCLKILQGDLEKEEEKTSIPLLLTFYGKERKK